MKRLLFTRSFKIIMITALCAVLIVLNPEKIFNPVRSGFMTMLLPFQKVFYSIAVDLKNGKEFISAIGQLKKENERLMKDNQRLLVESAMVGDVKNENVLLREQLDLLPRDRYELEASFVVSRDPNGTGNWLEIDKGSDDGLVAGMPVIVSQGIFIGRIKQVGAKSSQVILLTNPKSTVNVMTVENSAKGVAKGEYGLGIILDMVLQTDSIKVGDRVVTSGVGGEITRGLYVGTIQEVHQSDDHLFQQAVLAPPLSVSKLQMVFVIKGNKQ